MGGPNAGPAMLHWLIGDGELAQVVANHLRLWEAKKGPVLDDPVWKGPHPPKQHSLTHTLISTWLKVFPLYTPTMLPPSLAG